MLEQVLLQILQYLCGDGLGKGAATRKKVILGPAPEFGGGRVKREHAGLIFCFVKRQMKDKFRGAKSPQPHHFIL